MALLDMDAAAAPESVGCLLTPSNVETPQFPPRNLGET